MAKNSEKLRKKHKKSSKKDEARAKKKHARAQAEVARKSAAKAAATKKAKPTAKKPADAKKKLAAKKPVAKKLAAKKAVKAVKKAAKKKVEVKKTAVKKSAAKVVKKAASVKKTKSVKKAVPVKKVASVKKAAPVKKGKLISKPIKKLGVEKKSGKSASAERGTQKKTDGVTVSKGLRARATKPEPVDNEATMQNGRYALPSTVHINLPAGYKPSPKEEYMGPRQLQYFRTRLSTWRVELVEESRQTIESLRDEVRDVGDDAERATRETENSLELRTRDRYRKLIAKIDNALKRIEEGRYGFCEETDEEIGLDRLDARPIATLSLDAQERREHRQKQMGD
jgi:DnaK suppressor protein